MWSTRCNQVILTWVKDHGTPSRQQAVTVIFISTDVGPHDLCQPTQPSPSPIAFVSTPKQLCDPLDATWFSQRHTLLSMTCEVTPASREMQSLLCIIRVSFRSIRPGGQRPVFSKFPRDFGPVIHQLRTVFLHTSCSAL